MAKKVEIELDIKSNVSGSMAELKALKKQLKDTAAGSEEFKKLYNEIDDLEDKIKSAKRSSSDWIDSLESAGGPLGAVGAGLNKVKVATQSFGGALKATGIGLIVALIGGLVAAFSQTEGSMKKLEPLLIGMEKIFGGILAVIQPLLDSFLDLALKALPYITSGIGKLYSGFVAFFTLLKEAGTGAGKILKGIFTLDTDSITEGYQQIKGSLGKTLDAYDEGVKRFESGTQSITKTQKKNAEELKAIADKALADRLKNLDTNDKLDQSVLEKEKQLALAEAFNDAQRLSVEEKFYEKSYQLRKKDIEDKQKEYKEGSNEYKELQTQLNTLDAERITKVKEFKDKDKNIREKSNKEIVDFEIQLAKDLQALDEKTLNDKLNKEAKEKGDRDSKYIRMSEFYMNDLDNQRKLLEEKKIADEKYYTEQLAREGLTADQIRELNDRKLADQILYSQQSNQIERDRVAVKLKALDDIASIAGAESDIGRAALIAKQILLGKELIMEISRTITFGKVAVANATVDIAAGAAKTAKIGFPENIPMLIGYAAQAAAILSAIKSAVGGAKGAAGSDKVDAGPTMQNKAGYAEGGMINGPLHAGGGVMINAEGGEAVMTRGAVTMFGPLLSQLNQAGGGTSFSNMVGTGQSRNDNPQSSQSDQMIIKTYVVENELTTSQHRQARLKDLSTL
jgi:hypothetical protein